MEQRQYINREYKNLFGVCVCVWGGGGGGGGGGGWGGWRRTETVNVSFFIPQRAHKVPFLIIQRTLDVAFFNKGTLPFFVPGVNTTVA